LARADVISKHLEEGDWDVDPIEGGVKPQLGADHCLQLVRPVVACAEWTPAATSSWQRR
jgi:hypothetical protein